MEFMGLCHWNQGIGALGVRHRALHSEASVEERYDLGIRLVRTRQRQAPDQIAFRQVHGVVQNLQPKGAYHGSEQDQATSDPIRA
jgi:hypothetical protein